MISPKWFFQPDEVGITRPAGDVGIGFMVRNTSAKLEVNGSANDRNVVNIKAPAGINRSIFNIFKGNEPVFWG